MHDLSILLTFAGGLVGALLLGYLAHRLKLSPIVGYLVAGIVVGPFTPGFVANRAVAEQFAEIGVILLLFGIGLRFHLRELLAVWRIAIPGALIQSALSTTILAALLHLLGWSWTSGFILGMAISVASTVVMALVLGEWHDLHAHIGHVAVGWTVVEDLLTVVLLLLLPLTFGSVPSADLPIGMVLGLAGLKILALGAIVFILGKWAIPWALERIAGTRSRELFTLAVLGIAVGVAVGSSLVFGVSMALGAFLAGLAVGRSDFAARAANDALPMRDAFAVLFFVSVGMLFDPRSLIESPLPVLLVLLAVVVVKPLAATLTVRLLGEPMSSALPIGAAFSQIGEFSFILGTVALGLGLIDTVGWNALVAASIISIALNPYVYRWARRRSAKRGGGALPEREHVVDGIDPDHCILVGYGPVGRIVHQLLIERGRSITVIDLNLNTVRALKAEGREAIYGDVLRPGTLDEAGIARAGSLILSADVENAVEIVRHACSLNPDLYVLVRCSHMRDAPALQRAGANVVAAGEAEVGVALVEALMLEDLTSEEGLAHHREDVRMRLYGMLVQ